jgi:hypothetical protein
MRIANVHVLQQLHTDWLLTTSWIHGSISQIRNTHATTVSNPEEISHEQSNSGTEAKA